MLLGIQKTAGETVAPQQLLIVLSKKKIVAPCIKLRKTQNERYRYQVVDVTSFDQCMSLLHYAEVVRNSGY